jgi:hypothetical protein
MTFPNVKSPLGGIAGAFTASFFKLDPTGTVPLEPLLDLVPGLTPLRVTFDMIDSESESIEFDVTEHAVQSFVDITTNIRERLKSLTFTGTIGGSLPLQPVGPQAPTGPVRFDLIRLENLKNLARKRRPVMVITPRVGFAQCAIVSIGPSWSPADGESSLVSVTVREVRLISPLTGQFQPDYPAQAPANNAATSSGQTATQDTGTTFEPGAVDGLSPGPEF